jgi:hypothetical protein
MSLLRVSVLSLSGITLWLLPPFIFSKRVPLHNFTQGIALVASFACCFEARKGALKLAKEEEFEALKARAIYADVAHEISTSVYISEEQRKQEAEEILSGSREEDIETLKKAWLLDCRESEPISEPAEPTVQSVQPLNRPHSEELEDSEQLFTRLNLSREQALGLIKKLKTELNQTQIIEKLWECKKGGSKAWNEAYAQFKELTGE